MNSRCQFEEQVAHLHFLTNRKLYRADNTIDPIGYVGVAQGPHSPVENEWICCGYGLDRGRLNWRRRCGGIRRSQKH